MDKSPARRKFNSRYRVLDWEEYLDRKAGLAKMAQKVVYTGNPKHKKNPGDFGLTPPCDPRPLASLCDSVRIFKKEVAQDLLRKAFLLGLVDARAKPGEWPKMAWMVYEDHVLQAMYENVPGQYHGFPLSGVEPICNEVMRLWKDRRTNLP